VGAGDGATDGEQFGEQETLAPVRSTEPEN
jgi:hypothetical protein